MNQQNPPNMGLKSLSSKIDDVVKSINDLKNQLNELQKAHTQFKTNQEQQQQTTSDHKKAIDNLNSTVNNILNS